MKADIFVETYLDQDEHVIWTEKPKLRLIANKMEDLVPFLFATIIFIFGIRMSKIFEYGFHFRLYELPKPMPLITFIFMELSSYAYAIQVVKEINTTYYITNKNLIITIKDRTLNVRKRSIENIIGGNMDLLERKNGSGNIIFEENLYTSHGAGSHKQVEKTKYGFAFLEIERVADVYKMINGNL